MALTTARAERRSGGGAAGHRAKQYRTAGALPLISAQNALCLQKLAQEVRVAVNVEIKGHRYQVRPVVASDEALLLSGFETLSDEARRMRFFVPTPRLSRTQLHYLTDVDQENHVAFGILDGSVPLALGRFIRLEADPRGADIALTVVDSHQRRGLGLFLLEMLAFAALSRDIDTLHFDVLAENEPMCRLLERLGARRTEDGALVHFVLDPSTIPAPPNGSELVRMLDAVASVRVE